jgi:hypothetical protein
MPAIDRIVRSCEAGANPVNHQYWIPLRANPSVIARGASPELFVFRAPGAGRDDGVGAGGAVGHRTARGRGVSANECDAEAARAGLVPGYTRPIIDNQDMNLGAWVMGQLTVSLVLVVVASTSPSCSTRAPPLDEERSRCGPRSAPVAPG